MTAVLLKTKTLMYLAMWKRGFYLSESGHSIRTLELNEEQWRDLGCPSEITVTIEPGDLLNEVTP